MNKRNMVSRVVADILDNTIVMPKDEGQAATYTTMLNAAKPFAPDPAAMETAARQAFGLQVARLEGRAPARAPKVAKSEAKTYDEVKVSQSQPERIADAVLVNVVEPRIGLRALSTAVLEALAVEVAEALAWHKSHVAPVAGVPAVTMPAAPAVEVVSATSPVNLPIGVAPDVPVTGKVPTNDVNPGAFTHNDPGVIVPATKVIVAPVVVKPTVARKRQAAAKRIAGIAAPNLTPAAKSAILAGLAGKLTPAAQAMVAAAL